MVLIFIISLFGIFQDTNFAPFNYTEAGTLEYSTHADIPGQSADQIYRAARIWIAESFQQPDKVLVYEDAATHTLIIKPIASFFVGQGMTAAELSAYFTLKIIVTDGRADMYYSGFQIWYPYGQKYGLEWFGKGIHIDRNGNIKTGTYKTVGPYISAVLDFDRALTSTLQTR